MSPTDNLYGPGVFSYNLLRGRPAGDWLRGFPNGKPPRRLLGDLWREGELCLLFGPTGTGKSIFATQIADAIARGGDVPPFTVETPPQKVIYFDFEMTTAQFAARYSDGTGPQKARADRGKTSHSAKAKFSTTVHHQFPKKLIRVEMLTELNDPASYGFESFRRHFSEAFYDQIECHRAKVVIFDGLTYVSDRTRGSAGAARVMKELRRIKSALGVSMLVVANARQRRRPGPLNLCDVAAAPTVAELADCVFAIAPSTCGPDVRYLKHLKSRSGESICGEQDVAFFDLTARQPALAEPAAPALLQPPAEAPSVMISFDELVRRHSAARASREIAVEVPTASTRTPAAPADAQPPFPHFRHLGFSPEIVHIVDPAKQAELAERRERRRLREARSVTNMLMSREYRRYLER